MRTPRGKRLWRGLHFSSGEAKWGLIFLRDLDSSDSSALHTQQGKRSFVLKCGILKMSIFEFFVQEKFKIFYFKLAHLTCELDRSRVTFEIVVVFHTLQSY